MDAFNSYIYGSSLWVTIQALPLFVSPTIVVSLLSREIRGASGEVSLYLSGILNHDANKLIIAEVEEYLSRSLGMALFAIGFLSIFLAGDVPLPSKLSDTADAVIKSEIKNLEAPYAVFVLITTMLYHSAVAVFCYVRYSTSNQTPYILGSIGSASLASLGLWCVLFSSSDSYRSKKTGADKRTSGYPFSNKNSAAAQKKQMKKSVK
ncbi:hypothetical protein GcC1_173004 [Golovinomyces cichoracearum]|uniref:Uncharacterized protein n=1 Tax=Golovinomyces cichoracearum TaxID=62708 RepID=A0A420HQF6_9PEZI|nr:hypothetical protein GcC1_173004 [Golovinomyces cichoracearum]